MALGTPALELRDGRLGGFASAGAEMIELRDVAQPAFESRGVCRRFDSLGGARHFGVVNVPRRPKQGLDLCVGEAVYERRAAHRFHTTSHGDFLAEPLEILACLRGEGQGVHRILDRDRAESLQAPPDLDAEVVRLRWELMDEQQPAPVFHSQRFLIAEPTGVPQRVASAPSSPVMGLKKCWAPWAPL